MKQNVENHVVEMLVDQFGQKDAPEHISWIKDCLNKCDLISVFEIDNYSVGEDFALAIIQALFKGGYYSVSILNF